MFHPTKQDFTNLTATYPFNYIHKKYRLCAACYLSAGHNATLTTHDGYWAFEEDTLVVMREIVKRALPKKLIMMLSKWVHKSVWQNIPYLEYVTYQPFLRLQSVKYYLMKWARSQVVCPSALHTLELWFKYIISNVIISSL